MRRRFEWDKKYLYWGITAFCVIAACVLFYLAMVNISVFGAAVKRMVSILGPFIWGIVFAYFLSPLMGRLVDKVFFPLFRGHKIITDADKQRAKDLRCRKTAKVVSVVICELILLTILAALVWLIIPQLYSSIETIITSSPLYFEKITAFIEKTFQDYPAIESYIINAADKLSTRITDWATNDLLPQFGNIVSSLSTGVYHAAKAIYNLIIGIIVSVYILHDNKNYVALCKKVLYSVFSVQAAAKILEVFKFTDRTFRGFFTGKLLDSAIIGVICYIGCAIMRMPYTLLVSVLIGVTNIIPFFGPAIGLVPAALLILLIDPLKCLLFVIFILVLQQVDGNIIGPKILGNSVGINGFWVMFSIIVGAGLFGFWGMLLGVPVFVVIYTGIKKLMERKLAHSDLPVATKEYENLSYIDPVTLEPFYKRPDTSESSELSARAIESKGQNTAQKAAAILKNITRENPSQK